MNMELTQPEPIMETQISNLKESMFITMKQLVVDMSQELFLWTQNQEPWTQSEQDHLVNFSDQTTSSLVKLELVTIGQKDIILKELNLLTQSLMLSEKKLKDATVFKDSKSLTLWEVVPDQEWEHF